jgi:hypothetical protein
LKTRQKPNESEREINFEENNYPQRLSLHKLGREDVVEDAPTSNTITTITTFTTAPGPSTSTATVMKEVGKCIMSAGRSTASDEEPATDPACNTADPTTSTTTAPTSNIVVEVRAFPFGSARKRLPPDFRSGPIDLVLCSDLIGLDQSLFSPLLKSLRDLCGPPGTGKVLFAHKTRAEFERGFFDRLRAEGWGATALVQSEVEPHISRESFRAPVTVYALERIVHIYPNNNPIYSNRQNNFDSSQPRRQNFNDNDQNNCADDDSEAARSRKNNNSYSSINRISNCISTRKNNDQNRTNSRKKTKSS